MGRLERKSVEKGSEVGCVGWRETVDVDQGEHDGHGTWTSFSLICVLQSHTFVGSCPCRIYNAC